MESVKSGEIRERGNAAVIGSCGGCDDCGDDCGDARGARVNGKNKENGKWEKSSKNRG